MSHVCNLPASEKYLANVMFQCAGAGIIMNILLPSLFGLHCIMGPCGVPPNIDILESLADPGKIDIWSMVPSLVDELRDT
jgi:hypothetical protein